MNQEKILEIFLNAKETMDNEAKILQQNLDNLKEQGDDGGFLEKGRRRQSKNDREVDRNFICGCGKDYFSYPALYTHIKNKHNGKAPEGTILEDQNKQKKQKSLQNISQLSKGDTNMLNEENEEVPMIQQIQESINKQAKISQQRIKYNTQDIFVENFEPLIKLKDSKGQTHPHYSFINQIDEKDDLQIHPLIQAINNISQKPDIELKNCDLIFAKFLFEISKQCTKTIYGMISLIFRALREMLNLYGYILLTKLEQSNKDLTIQFKGMPDNDIFTLKENCEYIPITFDFFCKEFLESYLETSDFNFEFLIQFLYHFNKWLVKYNLTQISLFFNSFQIINYS